VSKERRKVLVTGLAAITPLGLDASSSFSRLVEGRSGIRRITHFDPSALTSQIAGEVEGFDAEQWLDHKTVRKTDRFTHFAVGAARMAAEDAGLDLDALDGDRAGVVIGSGIGGLLMLEANHRTLLERGPRRISPFLIPGMIVNMASGIVSMELGFRGPNSSPVTACATSNHAIGDAMRMIQYGDADLVVAGGSEAVISELTVGGFCAMKALSRRNDEPEKASRPFDAGRDGFVFSEGCGLLVLESEDHARARGARVRAELCGFGMSADAFHISAPPPDGHGMVRVMRAALADSGLDAHQIDYVNAHGTSTPVGDVIEARAIRQVFGDAADELHVSSTKSMTGHLLGAAGGLEAVVTVMAMERGVIPPTINLDEPDPALEEPDIAMPAERFVPNRAIETPVHAALSNSFGFGGTNASLVFRRVDAA
jgi:3-oxoacyl-[acyl-carrier-protein] synthase II